MEEKEAFDAYLSKSFGMDPIDTFPQELEVDEIEFPNLED